MRFAIALCAMMSVQYSTIYAQQQKNSVRIAYLHAGSTSSISTDAFREGLRNLGYIDGKNLTIEHQYSHRVDSRLPDLATELLRLKPDLIFTANASAALALKNATTTVPIVVVLTADPVAIGLVKSLAQPGSNVTGLTLLSNSPEIIGKRLEILKEAVPGG
jgi:putative tryptophan/tyrosine transport system substrate-binding protein